MVGAAMVGGHGWVRGIL